MAVTQKFLGIGISELYYKEDGNIYLHYFINGDPMAGAGKVNIKIELDNNQVYNFNINANIPGYVHDYKSIALATKTPGATHNVKVTGTKDGTTKVSSRSITFPTQEDLEKIDINFTHRETNPPKLLTDTFEFVNMILNQRKKKIEKIFKLYYPFNNFDSSDSNDIDKLKQIINIREQSIKEKHNEFYAVKDLMELYQKMIEIYSMNDDETYKDYVSKFQHIVQQSSVNK